VRAVIGLGNPGRRYEKTRHNIGYRIIESIQSKYKIPLKPGKGDYYYAEIPINDSRVLLVKLTAYMNRSGLAVTQLLKYFPLSTSDILITYDDFNLDFGTLRFRASGSDGGHNGIRSLIYALNTEDFDRLRFGIGSQFSNAVGYVLSTFSQKEMSHLDDLLDITNAAIVSWIEEGIEITMNRFNRSYLNENSS
jgi:PTH1 family peptidyl-tRNA hydrolase